MGSGEKGEFGSEGDAVEGYTGGVGPGLTGEAGEEGVTEGDELVSAVVDVGSGSDGVNGGVRRGRGGDLGGTGETDWVTKKSWSCLVCPGVLGGKAEDG